MTDAIATAAGDDCIRIFEQVFSLPSYSRKENNENDYCEGGLDAPSKMLHMLCFEVIDILLGGIFFQFRHQYLYRIVCNSYSYN